MSTSNSRTKTWHWRAWHALKLLPTKGMKMKPWLEGRLKVTRKVELGKGEEENQWSKMRWKEMKKELGRRRKQTCGCKQVNNKRPYFGANFNEGLECEWMELSNHLKWLFSPWPRHQGHVRLIGKDIFFMNVNTFLQELFRRRGKTKWTHGRGAKIKNLEQKSHPIQERLQHNRDNIWYKETRKWMQRKKKKYGST